MKQSTNEAVKEGIYTEDNRRELIYKISFQITKIKCLIGKGLYTKTYVPDLSLMKVYWMLL